MNRFLKPPDRTLNSLSGSEKSIYNYLEKNLSTISQSSISEISKSTYSSPSAVFNVLKKLGYSGFKEFKFECRVYQKELQKLALSDTLSENRYDSITNKVSIDQTIENQKFQLIYKVCKEIKAASRILVVANEITKFVVNDFTYRLRNLGIDIDQSFDFKQYELLLSQNRYDYVIVFSKYGNTEKIINAVEKSNRKIDLLITSNRNCYMLEFTKSTVFGVCSSGCIANAVDTIGDVNSRVELYVIADMIINTYIYIYFYEKEKNEKI